MKTTSELKAAIREKIALLQNTLKGIEAMEAEAVPAFRVMPTHSLGNGVEEAVQGDERRRSAAAAVELIKRIDTVLSGAGAPMDVAGIVDAVRDSGFELGARGDVAVRNSLKFNSRERGWNQSGGGLWHKAKHK